MIKQILIPIILVAAFIVAVGLFMKRAPNLAPVNPSPQTQNLKTIAVGGKEIHVEMADTPALRSRGLSGRTSLEEDRGMLFAFDSKNLSPTFWMKDMKIAIDIIWIDSSSNGLADAKIIRIDKGVVPPPEGTPDSELALFNPGAPIDYVLEVNAGFSDKNGIKVGDSVDLSGI